MQEELIDSDAAISDYSVSGYSIHTENVELYGSGGFTSYDDSQMPAQLVPAHAECLALLRSLRDGEPFDTPKAALRRKSDPAWAGLRAGSW